MLALFITGIFSRNERHWAVCPQLKKVVPLLLLLPGTVLLIDGDVFYRLALSEAALLGQDSLYNDQKKAAAAFSFFFPPCSLPFFLPVLATRQFVLSIPYPPPRRVAVFR